MIRQYGADSTLVNNNNLTPSRYDGLNRGQDDGEGDGGELFQYLVHAEEEDTKQAIQRNLEEYRRSKRS